LECWHVSVWLFACQLCLKSLLTSCLTQVVICFHLSSEALKHLCLSSFCPCSFPSAVIFGIINLLQLFKLTAKLHFSALCNVIKWTPGDHQFYLLDPNFLELKIRAHLISTRKMHQIFPGVSIKFEVGSWLEKDNLLYE